MSFTEAAFGTAVTTPGGPGTTAGGAAPPGGGVPPPFPPPGSTGVATTWKAAATLRAGRSFCGPALTQEVPARKRRVCAPSARSAGSTIDPEPLPLTSRSSRHSTTAPLSILTATFCPAVPSPRPKPVSATATVEPGCSGPAEVIFAVGPGTASNVSAAFAEADVNVSTRAPAAVAAGIGTLPENVPSAAAVRPLPTATPSSATAIASPLPKPPPETGMLPPIDPRTNVLVASGAVALTVSVFGPTRGIGCVTTGGAVTTHSLPASTDRLALPSAAPAGTVAEIRAAPAASVCTQATTDPASDSATFCPPPEIDRNPATSTTTVRPGRTEGVTSVALWGTTWSAASRVTVLVANVRTCAPAVRPLGIETVAVKSPPASAVAPVAVTGSPSSSTVTASPPSKPSPLAVRDDAVAGMTLPGKNSGVAAVLV